MLPPSIVLVDDLSWNLTERNMAATDPLSALLAMLRESVPREHQAAIEDKVHDFLGQFALVPKADFEAQVKVIENLERQAQDLQQRIDTLEHRGTNAP